MEDIVGDRPDKRGGHNKGRPEGIIEEERETSDRSRTLTT